MISPGKIIPIILMPDLLVGELERLCATAKEAGFQRICVPPLFIKKAREFLGKEKISIGTVIGYPFGYSAVEAKVAEVVLAIVDGADELNVMINTAALKNNDWQYLAHELNALLSLVKSKGKIINIIIEAALMAEDEIVNCCDLYGIAGVDAIIASSGFFFDTASIPQIQKIRRYLADQVKIIAVLNVNNSTFASDLLDAGASFITTNEFTAITQQNKT